MISRCMGEQKGKGKKLGKDVLQRKSQTQPDPTGALACKLCCQLTPNSDTGAQFLSSPQPAPGRGLPWREGWTFRRLSGSIRLETVWRNDDEVILHGELWPLDGEKLHFLSQTNFSPIVSTVYSSNLPRKAFWSSMLSAFALCTI